MTARQVYEGALIELNKVEAPSLLLEDFNYIFNKAINQYVNKQYNIYDINQQTTDDLRVLKATLPELPVKLATNQYGTRTGVNSLYGATYEALLPSDYLHILNCVCNFKVNKTIKCYDAGSYVQFAARRLTADLWSQVIHNFYMRPTYKRPYFYVHNVSTSDLVPTDPYTAGTADKYPHGTDISSAKTDTATNATTITGGLPRTIKIGENSVDAIEREGQIRYGNTSPVRLEIRYGKDNSVFELESVDIDYLKAPQLIRLTQEQLDLTEDTSQMMEFPDYVCQEIINELVRLVLENSREYQRIEGFTTVSTSVANPAQQQAQPKK